LYSCSFCPVYPESIVPQGNSLWHSLTLKRFTPHTTHEQQSRFQPRSRALTLPFCRFAAASQLPQLPSGPESGVVRLRCFPCPLLYPGAPRHCPRRTPTTLHCLMPAITGNTFAASLRTDICPQREESSSTSHARNPFNLNFFDSAQCLMVRRWLLIGYFPILYNPGAPLSPSLPPARCRCRSGTRLPRTCGSRSVGAAGSSRCAW
jgi:hypothetical protein